MCEDTRQFQDTHMENASDGTKVQTADELVVHCLEAECGATHTLDIDAVQSLEMFDARELNVEPHLVAVVRVTFAIRRQRLRRARNRGELAELGNRRGDR